jgi:hypothetical protein
MQKEGVFMKIDLFKSGLHTDRSAQARLAKRSNLFSFLRFFLFLFIIAVAAAGYDFNQPALYAFSAVLAAAFFRLVHAHEALRSTSLLLTKHTDVLQHYMDRFSGNWHEFPEAGTEYLSEEQPQYADLDIFGKNSIYQYICIAQTKSGRDRLAAVMSPEPAAYSDIVCRQRAVQEFINRPTLAIELQAMLQLLPKHHDTRPMIASCENTEEHANRFLYFTVWILPVITLLSFALAAANMISWLSSIILLFLQFFIASLCFGRNSACLAPLFNIYRELKLYRELFERLENITFQSSYLNKLQKQLLDTQASHFLRRLYHLSECANMRYNLFFFFFANTILLWDFHCVLYFFKWRNSVGKQLRLWFDTFSEIEMLLSLAVIGQTRELYTFPIISADESPHIEAKALTNLLLTEDAAVANNLSALGEVHIITGSNMSGKTTFLRTLASAAILAYAGAPVCADSLTLTRMHVFTSMRVNDDITKGLSTFYAELLRIKSMVEFSQKEKPMLVCIDEIFKGTNSADRIIGAREAIKKLANPWSITIVSTHDFELCELAPEIEGIPVTNYHFEEYYTNDKINFDYTIKTGRCQTTNAKYLLKLAGIL